MQEPEKHQLLILLDPVKHEWKSIGEQLAVRNGDIQSLQYRLLDDETRLSEVLQFWINQRKREVCWKTIITVIKNPPVNNVNVANRICHFLRDEYNSGKEGIQLTHSQKTSQNLAFHFYVQ